MAYEIPSSFKGGILWASQALTSWNAPQAQTSPVIQPTSVKQTFLPPKPAPVDPNLSPEVFKKRFIEKNGDGISTDGRKYSSIPAPEIVVRIIRKLWDGTTTDGKKYSDFLPRPASPNDSLEYRLKQLEELYKIPKSEFYTDWVIRGQTEKEKQFTTEVMNRKNESELTKTLKAPYRGLESVGQTLAYGTAWVGADVADVVWADELSDRIREAVERRKFKWSLWKDTSKGMFWSPSAALETLSSWAGYMLTGARIPLYLTALAGGGSMSLEGEQQWQWDFLDKVTAYWTGGISAAIDRMSGQNVISWLTRAGVQKKTATTFVDKMNNYLKGLKPSDLEAGTEIIQQKIENIGRDIMGVDYDKGIRQYFEVGLLGKVLGKIGDKGRSQATVTTLPPEKPKLPQSVNKNLEVIQTIKTGLTGNKVLKQAKARWFDPELDIATYEDLKPTITNDGRVNTDVAQENLQNFIEPYQEKLDNAIAQEGEYVPADTFRKEVLKEMESEKTNIVDYNKWVKLANTAIDTAVENFWDSNGNIPLEAVNNIKKKLQSSSNYLNPDDSAYKAIARGAKQIVEDYTKSVDVKALNRDLARWYTTREYLQILGSGTKTVKWGRLGKWVARLAGVIIGSKLWPIAGVVGGEVAAKMQWALMKWALKKTKQEMPTMDQFMKIKKKEQLLLPPPSGVKPSWNVVDVKPMTGYSPWVLNKNNNAISRQTSSNTTVTPQSQSPLAQVLEWKSKKPVIPVKKESKESLPWKKVNNSIIDGLKKKKETVKNSIVEKLKKKEVKANLPKKTVESKLPKKKEIDFSVKYKTEADRIAHEEALAKWPVTKTIYKAGDKWTAQDAIDKEFNLKRETPKVEGRALEQWTFWGIKWVQPKNQAKFNQWENFEPVRVVMNDKDARIVRYWAIRSRWLKKWFTTADNAEMKSILDELWITREEAINRSEEIKKLAREARSAKEEVILDLTKLGEN